MKNSFKYITAGILALMLAVSSLSAQSQDRSRDTGADNLGERFEQVAGELNLTEAQRNNIRQQIAGRNQSRAQLGNKRAMRKPPLNASKFANKCEESRYNSARVFSLN